MHHARRRRRCAEACREMPELPDITAYLEALQPRVVGQPLERVRLGNPFLVRTIRPEPRGAGRATASKACIDWASGSCSRFEADLYIDRAPDDRRSVPLAQARRGPSRQAGSRGVRLPRPARCSSRKPAPGARPRSTSSKGRTALAGLQPGRARGARRGPAAVRDPADARTITRSSGRSTDPHIFSGIGNAYSDEILHAARLSPMKLTVAA